MRNRLTGFVLGVIWIGTAAAEPALTYSFNDYSDGPIEGQSGWNIYEKVKDSSALSILNELGTSESKGDKALVIRASEEGIRCVTGEPVRWLPGRTLTVKFDFKIAAEPAQLAHNKPSLTVMIGNSLLSDKASWSVGLEATPAGDWLLAGEMPDAHSRKIYGENFLIRSDRKLSISEWHTFVLVAKKMSEPDTFEVSAEIRNALSKEVVAALEFTDEKKDKVTAMMWNTTRAHAGFQAPKDLLGLVCIDNLEVSASK